MIANKTIKELVRWAAVASGILLFLLIDATRIIAVIMAMCAISYATGKLGSLLTFANIGVSFSKFMIIVLMYKYGISTAIIGGTMMYLVEFLGQSYWKAPVLVIIPNIILMPLYGFWVVHSAGAWAGIILLVLSNGIETIATTLMGVNFGKSLMYYATNVLFNIPLFFTLGPLLL